MIRSCVSSNQNRAKRLRVLPLAGVVIAAAAAVALAGVGSPAGAVTRTATASKPAGSGDWAQYRYSAARTGFNPFEHVLSPANVSKLTKLWSVPVTGAFGSGPPAVVNGVVYFGTDVGAVFARMAATGRLLWKFTGPETFQFVDAVVNGIVYVSTAMPGTANPNLYALNTQTGHKLWSLAIGPEAAVVQNGVVYVGSSSGLGAFYALNAATGRKIWSVAGVDSAGVPAVANGVVYIASGGHIVMALRAATGRTLWSFTVPGNGGTGGVAVANGLVYFGVNDGSFDPNDAVYALSTSTGAVRWRFQITGQTPGLLAVAHGLVYVPSSLALYALRATTGSKVWAVTKLGGFGTAAVANGVVYAGSPNDSLHALDAATGRVLLTLRIGSPPAGDVVNVDPAVASGMVFFGTSVPGRFYAFGLPRS